MLLLRLILKNAFRHRLRSILTIVGTIPWTIFLVYMGAMLGENWHSLLSYKLEIALVCIVICAIIAAAFHFYQKHKNNKHEAQ